MLGLHTLFLTPDSFLAAATNSEECRLIAWLQERGVAVYEIVGGDEARTFVQWLNEHFPVDPVLQMFEGRIVWDAIEDSFSAGLEELAEQGPVVIIWHDAERMAKRNAQVFQVASDVMISAARWVDRNVEDSTIGLFALLDERTAETFGFRA